MKTIKVNKHAKPPKLIESVEAVNAAVSQMAALEQVRHQVKSMVLYREDLYYDTEDTDFHRIMRGDFFGKGKDKISSAVLMLNVVLQCTRGFVLDKLFTPEEKAGLGSNAFGVVTKLDGKNAALMASATRLLKEREGISASIPLGNLSIPSDFLTTKLVEAGKNLRTLEDAMEKVRQIKRIFGSSFFDLAEGVDVQFPTAQVIEGQRPNFLLNPDLPVTPEFLELLRTGIKSVRVTAPQQPKATWPSIVLGEDTAATSISDLSQLKDYPEDALSFIKKVIGIRLESLSSMVVFHIEPRFAQAVAQMDYKDLKLQYVGAWIRGTAEAEFGKTKGVADFMTPLTSIREFNKTSRYVGKKKTNDSNLMITRKGDIMFIPEVDNIDFVEQQIESEAQLDNGEWSLNDSIRPESSNYEVRSGNDGIERRYRKTKGANRVVYTDWKNGKFCYTDGSGGLRVMELSSCRPVDATHIVGYTRANIANMEKVLVNALVHAATTPGLVSPPTEDELRQCFPATGHDKALDVLRDFNQESFGLYLSKINLALMKIFLGEEAEGLNVSDQFRQYLEETYNNGLPMSEIWPDSPVAPLRCIARTMQNVLRHAMEDLDRFTAGRSVFSALNEMGFASIITSYGGKGRQVILEDEQLRKKYLEPDLKPVKELTIENIPFVKALTVQPHQVKVWNYLKNAPEAVILDVAAGGGKTILALLDIAYTIGMGIVKKALVMMPNNLIKNYINDGNLVFKGRMNFVVLNGETMASWGQERLMKLIDAAPINTIFLTSYDFFKSGKEFASYGTVGLEVSMNADFMKQFNWDGVWMDESHKLKNEDSQTTRSVMELVAGIPYRRQLTGTYIPDTYTDVVAQFGAMNPSVFGDKDTFEKRYKAENAGRGAWIPNAGRMIRARMAEYSNVVTIKRREWRALLPDPKEAFWPVELTVNQSKVYKSILEETLARLEELIANDPKLREMMEQQDGNEEIQEALASILNPYMQRLEKFLSAPGEDETSALLVDEEDRISPKLKKAYELIRDHLNKGIPGKILIFTQYKSTAKALFEFAPPDIKDKIVHYTASNKVACMQEFENNPSKMIMVGVETSMNTGLNLQFCSRLIRMETVWNWGNLEQGEARVMRPNLKVVEFREAIYFDWVFCNRTVDVTKTSRMIAKLVSTAKFYEPEDANFQRLPDLEMVKMSLKTIAERNSWEDETSGLIPHFQAYQAYRNAEHASFEEFKRNPMNRTEPFKITDGGIPSNLGPVGMLAQVPYIADMELFGMDDLGLQTYSEFMNDKAPPGTKDPINNVDPTGLGIHTEDGDGVCTGPGTRRIKTKNPDGSETIELVQTGSIWVQLNDGSKRSYPKSNVFVITKKHTNSKSVRQAMAKLAGADTGVELPIEPVLQPSKPVKQVAPKKSANEKVEDNEVLPNMKLYLVAYNEYMCLAYNEEDSPSVVVKDMQKLGFVPVRSYAYSEVKRWQQLEAWIEAAADKFHIDDKLMEGLNHTLEMWRKSRNNLHLLQQLNPTKLRDFLLKKMRPVVKGEIKPYIMVMDNVVHLCLDRAANGPMLSKVRALRIPGIHWDDVEDGDHFKFMKSKTDVRNTVEKIKERYNITNYSSFTKGFNEIRIMNAQPRK